MKLEKENYKIRNHCSIRGDGQTLRRMKFVAPDELPLLPAMILTVKIMLRMRR
jgi:hypothetical protein